MATTSKLTVGSYVGFAEPKSNVKAEDDFCVVCGKKMGKNGFYVHLSIDATVLAFDYEGSQSQGCWNVGSECAKQFDSSVITKAGN